MSVQCQGLNKDGQRCKRRIRESNFCWIHQDKKEKEIKNKKEKEKEIQKEELCPICCTETLDELPSLILKCGHSFHVECIKKQIDSRWPSSSIVFRCLNCPLCNQRMDHPSLKENMLPLIQLEKQIIKHIQKQIKLDDLKGEFYDFRNKIPDEGSEIDLSQVLDKKEQQKIIIQHALDIYSFFPCFKCKNPFFGGRKNCIMEIPKPEDLLCSKCNPPKMDEHVLNPEKQISCGHEKSDLIWKCRFCCSLAAYRCGTNHKGAHFCEKCHHKAGQLVEFSKWSTILPPDKLPQCSGKDQCPLKCTHPPNGTEYCLGCAKCKIFDNVKPYVPIKEVHLSLEDLRNLRIKKFEFSSNPQ